MKTVEDEEIPEDDRSVDDLLSFINGDSNDIDTVKASNSKSKKKNKRRKEKQKNAPLVSQDENHKDLDNNYSEGCNHLQPCSSKKSDSLYTDDAFATEECDDNDDDEIDPAMKEQIDREVEDFTRRLNLNWQERIQELLYGPEREANKFAIHNQDNDSMKKYEQGRTERQSVEPG